MYAKIGRYGLCVASRPGLSADELARRWTYTGEYYLSTNVSTIRELGDGFDVVRDAGAVHALVMLPREPHRDHVRDDLWPLLQRAFASAAARNPLATGMETIG